VKRLHPAHWLKSRLMKDTATLQVSAMLNQASQLVSTVVLAYLLGSHGQGLFFLAISLQAVVYNLVNVGIVAATTTQVAAASVRDSREKVAGWLAFLAKANVIFSLGVIALGWWLLPIAANWYDHQLAEGEAENLGRWAWYLALWPLIDTPRVVAQVAFTGTRRMLRLGQLDNGQELVRAALVIFGAVISGGFEGALLGEIVSRVYSSYLGLDLYYAARRDGEAWLPSMRDVFRRAREVPFSSGMRLALRIGFIKNVNVLSMDLMPGLLLAGFAGPAYLAYYRVANKVMGVPLMMLQGVTRTILPALSEMRGLRDLEGFKRIYYRSTRWSGLIVGCLSLVMLPFVKPFVAALWPADYAAPVFTYSWILALGLVPIAFSVGLDAFYMLTDQMRTCLKIMLVGAFLTIPANVFVIWAFPETGAAWGQTIYRSYVFVHFAFVAWYFRHSAAQGHWHR
jgi:O-antigen/teichoic acid export membrane protein